MSWDSFVWFALAASALWLSGAVMSVVSKHRMPAVLLTGAGSIIFITFIAGVWVTLGRPPLRTMGETRLWFSLFLSLIGLGVYLRWRYSWVLPFGCLMAIVFACINIFKPEIHTEELMPALRSPWFVPHVIVYMFAYAVMGITTILAVRILWLTRKPVSGPSHPVTGPSHQVTEPTLVVTEPVEVTSQPDALSLRQAQRPKDSGSRYSPEADLRLCDTLVRIGWGFLTMGIVMGALWAKQAWGDYWTWDPKETWAAATWLSYLLYLHLRQGQGFSRRTLFLLIFSFLLLQMCWWGVNYLPSAQGFSLHTY